MGDVCCSSHDKCEVRIYPGANKIILHAQGLHCTECAVGIENYLNHLPGVYNASVDFVAQKASIVYNPAIIDKNKLQKALLRPGYDLDAQKTFWDYLNKNSEKFHISLSFLLSVIILVLKFVKTDSPFYFYFQIISLIIIGYPILNKAIKALLKYSLNVNLLVALAMIGAAYIGDYFEAAFVGFIMIFGEFLEDITVKRSKRAIDELMKLNPEKARVIDKSGKETEIKVENLKVGDIIIIKEGEKIPADGIILEGKGNIVESILTGEPIPKDKSKNDEVFAGTFLETGFLKVKVKQDIKNSKLFQIKKLVMSALSNKPEIQRISDKFAFYFIPVTLLTALIVYLITKDIVRAITILVVACPCSLVLSTPTAIIAAVGRAAKKGVLVKAGSAFEKFSKTDIFFMDKTGTLTKGEPAIVNIEIFTNISSTDALTIAAMIEEKSNHVLSRAFQKEKEKLKDANSSFEAKDVEILSLEKGKGCSAKVANKIYFIGSLRYIKENLSKPEKIKETTNLKTATKVYFSDENEIIARFDIQDELKPDVKDFVQMLKNSDIKKLIVLTGDNQSTAREILKDTGITEIYGELLPEEKIRFIYLYENNGFNTAMVGDGINDAPALALSNCGIAMGKNCAALIAESADIVLTDDKLLKIPFAYILSKKTVRTIKQNIVFSVLFNLIMVIFSSFGYISILFGAIMHQISSFCVIFNSMRINLTK